MTLPGKGEILIALDLAIARLVQLSVAGAYSLGIHNLGLVPRLHGLDAGLEAGWAPWISLF